MNKKHKISIETMGLEDTHLGILEFLISYYFKDDYLLTKDKDENKQVCIFHIKSDNDYKTLITHKEQNPAMLFIAITKNKIDDENIEVITFPPSPRKISDVLRKVKDKINKSSLSTQKNIKEKKSTVLTSKNYDKKSDIKKINIKNHTANKKDTIASPEENNENKKIESKVKIDDLHEAINKMKPHFSSDNIEKNQLLPSTKSDIKEIITVTNKAKNNKNKQISIKEDTLKFVASRSDINLNNPTIVASLVYPTHKHLQGALTDLYAKAKREDKITTLDTSYGIISYNPNNHKVFVSVNNKTLQSISSIANLKTKYLPQSTNNITDTNWESADALLWKTTIWASRGRLPIDADIDTPFLLKNWPNLTRFMMTPHAMEITALWVHEPITLRKTITLLAIPQRTVFSFYSASLALELVIFSPIKIQKNAPKNEKIESIVSKKKRKNFLGKLLNYFKPDNIEEI